MCYNCGCANPTDDMGNQDNITEHTFEHLAQSLHKSVDETKIYVFHLLEQQKNRKSKELTNEESQIAEIFMKAAKAWGQPIEEARKYTYELLSYESKHLMKKK